jgi:hypothetical protein
MDFYDARKSGPGSPMKKWSGSVFETRPLLNFDRSVAKVVP